ncbi:MAG: helix-turn-helix domain-containing protein [Rickettsiales bacterium]|jgi:transcriptional regulator with XRE-family HTH domain|nr:helix-turn-helix domain-containing protein [Rickettsiales bacterium]
MAYEEIIFPNNIRSIRLSRGIRMTKLAKDANLSLSAMSKIEKGVRRLNQNQLLLLCKILSCKVSDIFIKESDSAVASTWQSEMQKRLSANESSGLKIFGAGVRYLRKAASITIADAAKKAKITLSVYHKIEVGQRGIFEHEVEPLAKLFDMTGDKMFQKISELYKSGKLGKFITKNEEKVKSVLVPSMSSAGANFSGALYGAKIYDSVRKKLVPVYAEPDEKGQLVFSRTDEKMITTPVGLEGQESIYAIIPNPKNMGNMFPEHAYLFVDSDAVAGGGDMAVYLSEDFDKLSPDTKTHARIVLVGTDAKGKLIGRTEAEVLQIKNAASRLHKVMQIVME